MAEEEKYEKFNSANEKYNNKENISIKKNTEKDDISSKNIIDWECYKDTGSC